MNLIQSPSFASLRSSPSVVGQSLTGYGLASSRSTFRAWLYYGRKLRDIKSPQKWWVFRPNQPQDTTSTLVVCPKVGGLDWGHAVNDPLGLTPMAEEKEIHGLHTRHR